MQKVIGVPLVAPGAGPAVPLDWRSISPASIQVIVSGTVSYKVEGSMDDPTAGAPTNWTALANFPAASSANILASALLAYTFVRLNAATVTGGSVQMNVIQPGGPS